MTTLKAIAFSAALALLCAGKAGARSAAEYLPADADLDPAVPTPESVLGWGVGDWHVGHDKLLQYVHRLAEHSPRVTIEVTGRSHEERPLVLLTITGEENAGRLEAMRQAHLAGDDAGPLVLWLGYSVHGDEPSGSNAAMLVAYYLAASRSESVTGLLGESVVLIDPSMNPDGLNRYASWANSNAGAEAVDDPVTRQHVQPWPEGRTNHYWFDLNRDWLPLVHPESRARMAEYQRWRPHVLTDHHEQDRVPGFFFQPGVPSRQNPLTPAENLELTRALARYHGAAMDRAGQPVFSEDVFDDFYFGKGSTYPDINGAIGILFEQRAIGGQALKTGNGVETFGKSVANQFRASLSTLEGTWALRDRLKAYQKRFFADMAERARDAGFHGWLVSDDGDPGRAAAFLDVLAWHDIEYEPVAETVRTGGAVFEPGHAWLLPAEQRQSGLLQSLMEQRTEFADETFYDVSAWTLPLAYNLPFTTARQAPVVSEHTPSSSGLPPDADAAAWLVPWNQLEAAALLQRLLAAGARVRTALKPFSAQTASGLVAFEPGTLLVQAGIQEPEPLAKSRRILTDAALAGLQVHSVQQTLTPVGPDFGSQHFPIVEPVKPLLLGGAGISAYDAGEAWFLMDHRLALPTTIVEFDRLAEVALEPYTHIILPDGDYSLIGPEHLDPIRDRVLQGGVVLAVGRGAVWAEGMCFMEKLKDCPDEPPPVEEKPPQEPVQARPYGGLEQDIARLTIGGAIVATSLDTTHPLAFGFPRPELPIMRAGTAVLTPSENPYSTPVRYAAKPLMAGFVGEERLAEFAGQAAMIAEKRGEGLVVRFANNPLFRGFWRGSERLFLNALYFGQVVEATELPE